MTLSPEQYRQGDILLVAVDTLLAEPSAVVAVRDQVLDTEGLPLEHWIAVPPHIPTAVRRSPGASA